METRDPAFPGDADMRVHLQFEFTYVLHMVTFGDAATCGGAMATPHT